MKLAVVTETWPPEINGVANTLAQLVHGLRRHGHVIQLIRPRQQRQEKPIVTDELHEHLVQGLRLPFYPEVRFGLPHYWQLRKLWQRDRPDMVQIVTEGPLGYAALWVAKHLGLTVISDFHTRFDQYSQYYRAGLLLRLAEHYLRHFHNQTAMTLVPTQELKQQLAQKGYKNLAILARGIDTQLFNPNRRSLARRAHWGIAPDQLLVVLVARLAQEKNLDLAFSAFTAIQQQQPQARFMVVGDGPERARLQARYPQVIFTGMQTGVALAEYYASADLFLSPSTSETFGNVILEAMASGLPVVAYDYAAAHQYIQQDNNGHVVPLHAEQEFIAGAQYLASDAELRKKLGHKAFISMQALSWQAVVVRLDEILRVLTPATQDHASPAHYSGPLPE